MTIDTSGAGDGNECRMRRCIGDSGAGSTVAPLSNRRTCSVTARCAALAALGFSVGESAVLPAIALQW
jgi:hypothetical protein